MTTPVTPTVTGPPVFEFSGIAEDRSKKGRVDDRIEDLIKEINSCDGFCTTSSCSGRVTLMSEGLNGKKGKEWVYVSHEVPTIDAIQQAMERFLSTDRKSEISMGLDGMSNGLLM